jgi:hypothetical protein
MDSTRSDLLGGGSALQPVSGPSNPLPRHPGLNADPAAAAGAAKAEPSDSLVAVPEPDRLGQLTDVDPRELWPTGERELLAWLGRNPESMAEVTGLNLRPLADGTVPANDSLVLETDGGDLVVIVVDLGESSDNALGRLMRTVAATGAKASIWAAGTPRSEHLASMSWLNRTVTERSFILKLRAVRIDDSRAAPMFSPVLRPPRHSDIAGSQPPATAGVEVGRRADDWPSVTLIERGADGPA